MLLLLRISWRIRCFLFHGITKPRCFVLETHRHFSHIKFWGYVLYVWSLPRVRGRVTSFTVGFIADGTEHRVELLLSRLVFHGNTRRVARRVAQH